MISTNSNQSNQRNMTDVLRSAARILVCMLLAVALAMPMAFCDTAYAVTSTSTSKTSKYTTAKTQNISGITVSFDQEVVSNSRITMSPTQLRVVGKRRRMKLYWNGVVNPAGIDGYIIVRKVIGTQTWQQIGTVAATKTKYTDKTARAKNKYYQYSVLAYKVKGSKTLVSSAAGWAGGVTTRTGKKNVYTIKVRNVANVASIMIGSCAQTYLTFPKDSYSNYIRWWSNNPAVARVDANGKITGVSHGKTTINAKTHTGNILAFDVQITTPGTAQAMIETFRAWEGYSQLNGKHKSIVDIYNSVTPWPVGYKMGYSDAWCDCTVTAAAIKTGNVGRIGRECGVPRHIKIFKKLKIWEEDGTITPRPGDIIVFSWSKFSQPNNASASHIGIVEKVKGNTIYTIEGNRGIGEVSTRSIPVGWGCIRGYARPKYVRK